MIPFSLPETILSFILAAIGLIIVIKSYTKPQIRKIPSLFYIRLGFLCFSVVTGLDGLSYLLINETIARIAGMLVFPTVIFFIIGVNYTMKENAFSIGLLISFGLGFLLIYGAFLPGAIQLEVYAESMRMEWTGLFGIMVNLLTFINAFYAFYWGIKTWLNAPFLIKKEANVFFLGVLLSSVGFAIFTFLYLFETIFIFLADIALITGIFIIMIAIINEPKLLYILPFTVHRIVVKDRDGFPLYDYDWSESSITETIFTGFINAVQVMSEEVMDIGGLVDINLEEGILILHESEYITVGLVASKSSKLLKKTIVNFSLDFEDTFKKDLKASCKDMSAYESAYKLIEKHFSNFPLRIIKNNKHPVLLSTDYMDIPLELDNKLKEIFKDANDYELMKHDLFRSPECVPLEFLALYEEIKKHMDQSSQDNSEDSEI